MSRWHWYAIAGIVAAGILTAAASALFLFLIDRWGEFEPWFFAWPIYLIWARDDPVVLRDLLIAAAIAYGIPAYFTWSSYQSRYLFQARYMMLRQPHTRPWSREQPPRAHGDARLADIDQAAEKLGR